jgi:hypothetical protein
MTINELITTVENTKARSAWSKGIKAYALDLLEELNFNINHGYTDPDVLESARLLKKAILNGASDWSQYSWGGCSLIYDADIAKQLCTPSELKKTDNGRRNPNRSEQWLDVQARALFQAAHLIKGIAYRIDAKGVC